MKSVSPVVLFVSLVLGCMNNPRNGDELASRYEPLRISGFWHSPDTLVELETWHAESESWRAFGRVYTTAKPTIDGVGRDWYPFDDEVALPLEAGYWEGSGDTRTVQVRARIGNHVLGVFDRDLDLAACASEQDFDGTKIYLECRSDDEAATLHVPCGEIGELCCVRTGSCREGASCSIGDVCVDAFIGPPDAPYRDPANAGVDYADEGAQGITHDETHWYMSSTSTIYRVPRDADLSCSGTYSHRIVGFPAELPGEVNHYGDMDFDPEEGLLYVGYENTDADDRWPRGVVVFDRELHYVSHAPLGSPGYGTAAGWVAISPVNRLLYTSLTFDPVSYVRAYRRRWVGGELRIELHHILPLTDAAGNLLGLGRVQGGVISSNGNLYLSQDTDPGRVSVFDIDGRLRHVVEVPKSAWSRHEIEGITLWNIPSGSYAGKLHVQRRDQETFGQDDIDLYHYEVTGEP